MRSADQRRLPRGHHGLSPRQVEKDQKQRLIEAMVEAVSEMGYRGATVSEVIKRAGVSRATFYSFFGHRADCFAAAQRWAIRHVDRALKEEDPFAGLAALLAEHPGLARVIFVASPLAGPGPTAAYSKAIKRWSTLLAGSPEIARFSGEAAINRGPRPTAAAIDRIALGSLGAMISRHSVDAVSRLTAGELIYAALLPRAGTKVATEARAR